MTGDKRQVKLVASNSDALIGIELHSVVQQITSGLDLDNALGAVLSAVERLFGAASASIWLNLDRRLTTHDSNEPHWEDMTGADPRYRAVIAQCLETKEMFVVEDVRTHEVSRGIIDEGQVTVVGVPIHHSDTYLGILFANWDHVHETDESELRALDTLGTYGAIAIQNTRLLAREVEAARLEGVLLATRTVMHEIYNDVAIIAGHAELVAYRVRTGGRDKIDPAELEWIASGASRLVQHTDQLSNIVELVEKAHPGLPPTIDLDLSSSEPKGS